MGYTFCFSQKREVWMPWKECSVMDERLRFVAQLLDGEPMAQLCRAFGISRKTGYKIFTRYKEHGLEALTDRSRRPMRYANQLPPQPSRDRNTALDWGGAERSLVRRLQRRVQARQRPVLLPANRYRPRLALLAPVRGPRVDPRGLGHHRLRAALPGARPARGHSLRQRRAVCQPQRPVQPLQALRLVAPARHRNRAHQAWPAAAERPPRAHASHAEAGSDPPARLEQPAAAGPLRRLSAGVQHRAAARGARHEVPRRGLFSLDPALQRPAGRALSVPRPRCPRYCLRPHLPTSQEDQHLDCPRRPKARYQGGGRGYLDRELHVLRSGLYRLGAENLAAPRQPVRPEVVTHVLGTVCYPSLRAGHGVCPEHRQDL